MIFKPNSYRLYCHKDIESIELTDVQFESIRAYNTPAELFDSSEWSDVIAKAPLSSVTFERGFTKFDESVVCSRFVQTNTLFDDEGIEIIGVFSTAIAPCARSTQFLGYIIVYLHWDSRNYVI